MDPFTLTIVGGVALAGVIYAKKKARPPGTATGTPPATPAGAPASPGISASDLGIIAAAGAIIGGITNEAERREAYRDAFDELKRVNKILHDAYQGSREAFDKQLIEAQLDPLLAIDYLQRDFFPGMKAIGGRRSDSEDHIKYVLADVYGVEQPYYQMQPANTWWLMRALRSRAATLKAVTANPVGYSSLYSQYYSEGRPVSSVSPMDQPGYAAWLKSYGLRV